MAVKSLKPECLTLMPRPELSEQGVPPWHAARLTALLETAREGTA